MSCDHLICARCAGPVIEGRCATCRLTRAEIHGTGAGPGSQLLVIAALVLALALAIAVHLSMQ